MSDKTPATDEEIERIREEQAEARAVGADGSIWWDVSETLYARIEADAEIGRELVAVLEEVLEVLRIHAPGTPLNNKTFDQLGIRARAALAMAKETR